MFRIFAIIITAFATVSSASAQEQFEKWLVYSQPGRILAFTVPRRGEMLALLCEEKCKYLVSLNIGCEEGAIMPFIVNDSKAEGVSVDLTCHVSGGRTFFYLDDFDVTKLMRGNMIAFGWPSDDELISVSRFSLSGAKEATASAMALWKKAAAPVAPSAAK